MAYKTGINNWINGRKQNQISIIRDTSINQKNPSTPILPILSIYEEEKSEEKENKKETSKPKNTNNG